MPVTASEHDEQVALVQWFRYSYKGVTIFAIPNGGARNIVTAAKLKAEGVVPGVPDLFIPAWMLWVEMKRTKGGSTTDKQKDMHTYLERAGYQVIVAKGARDAQEKIKDFVTNFTHKALTMCAA